MEARKPQFITMKKSIFLSIIPCLFLWLYLVADNVLFTWNCPTEYIGLTLPQCHNILNKEGFQYAGHKDSSSEYVPEVLRQSFTDYYLFKRKNIFNKNQYIVLIRYDKKETISKAIKVADTFTLRHQRARSDDPLSDDLPGFFQVNENDYNTNAPQHIPW